MSPPLLTTGRSSPEGGPSGRPAGADGPQQPAAPLPPEVFRIRPSRGWRAVNLRELWHDRELLLFLTLRDNQLRYNQTALGVTWSVIQPLFTMLVFAVFFGQLGNLPSDGAPYPLFVMAALLPWQLFAYALTQSSTS